MLGLFYCPKAIVILNSNLYLRIYNFVLLFNKLIAKDGEIRLDDVLATCLDSMQ